jgi:serine/threonine protein kinase
MEQKTLCYDNFETIKKLGDGNFTKVFQVLHKKYPEGNYYALKISEI